MDLDLIRYGDDLLVDLATAKAHIGIDQDNTADDQRLTTVIEDATTQVERDANLCIVEQEWLQTEPYFRGRISLRMTPVMDVAVQYYDSSNQLQSMEEGTDYFWFSTNQEATITFLRMPSTYPRPDAVQITMTCGMTQVPRPARRACLMLIGAWNENREAEIVGNTSEVKLGYQRLIHSIRKGFFA